MYVIFQGHICCWYMYGNRMVKRILSLLFVFSYMCILYVDYSSSTGGHIYAMVRHIFSGAYAYNVKCMSTSPLGHIINCSEFI